MKKVINECCPIFNPEKWDKKKFTWENKNFIKESIPTLFHIPFPPMIGKKVVKMCKMAKEESKAYTNKDDILLLFTDPHPFKTEIYLSVTKQIDSANNIEFSGNYVSRVYDGPYSAIPKFIKKMENYLESEKKKAKKYYVHYAYCPKCQKKFGHNYMVIFAEV